MAAATEDYWADVASDGDAMVGVVLEVVRLWGIFGRAITAVYLFHARVDPVCACATYPVHRVESTAVSEAHRARYGVP